MIRSSSAYLLLLYCVFSLAALLVVLTGGHGRAIRWKLAVGTLILSLAGPVTAPISCKSGSSVESRKSDVWARDGWIDDDTYRQKAAGTPRAGYTNTVMRKESAKRAAVLYAQRMMIEQFKYYAIPEACCYALMSSEPNPARIQEMMGIVKGGSVLAERFDTDHNCEIVYEVKQKGLKQAVKNMQ